MGRLSWLLLPVLLVSCAYLFGGTQEIMVTTANGKPAACTLKNAAGQWHATTPQTVKIKTSATDLKISCAAKSLRAYKAVKADASHVYPATITVYMKAKRRTDAPDDNDETSQPAASSGDDMDSAAASKPLNTLPEDEDDESDVEIIRH